jgi:hypothetical protein
MPLPDGTSDGQPWPPTEVRPIYDAYAVSDAWFAGDTEALQALYATTHLQTGTSIWGQVKRRFWGTPTPTNTSQRPVKLHVPIAGEISRMSAALLFGEMPQVVFEDDNDSDDNTATTATQDAVDGPPVDESVYVAATARVQELLDDTAHAAWIAAAEYASAHGGSFLRVSWDKAIVPDRPFLTVMPADCAIPEFRFGRLTAVTFWTTLSKVAGLHYILLERHEPGTIEYGLYESGNSEQLGLRVPLASHPTTAGLVVDSESSVKTGSELLTAVYLPNIRPNRRWRKDPHGANLGRSDYDGVEDLMDALDEVYTSLMRDYRLGKARALVSKEMLQVNGPGNGATFNEDQEYFTALAGGVGSLNPQAQGGSNAKPFLETVQPNIRHVEHLEGIQHLREAVYQGAGYSPQTFGEASEGGHGQVTATEVTSLEKLTTLTRGEKILVARPELVRLCAALMDVDQFVFGGPGRAGLLPNIEWEDEAAISPETLARILQLLNLAEAISLQTRVQMLHPDWSDEQVAEEVDLIRSELSTMPIPSMRTLWQAEGASDQNPDTAPVNPTDTSQVVTDANTAAQQAAAAAAK